MTAPVLETERLRLRGRTLADFEAFAAIQADPEFQTYIAGVAVEREQAWIKFLRMEGHWSLLGYGFWAIEERATGRFIGEAGFANFKRDMIPDFSNGPEAGWGLAPEAQGKGYAREAMRAALSWMDNEFGAAETFCMIDLENARSVMLAQVLGYDLCGRARYKSSDLNVYLRQRGAGNA